jgi:clan AA aspartic protease
MTQGIVQDLQARLNISLRIPPFPDFSIECVVDTGFAGALTLPQAVIEVLQLPFFQEIEANLANDQDVKTSVYLATILWEGNEVEIAVLSMGRRPLLGTALLQNQRLVADFWEEGSVTITSRS